LRIGQNSYFFTRNPELWLAPPQGWGVLAGRAMEENRENSHTLPVNIRSIDTNHEWTVNTYGPEAVNSDEYYQENMVISDLPAGRYEVKITHLDKTDKVLVDVHPGRVTYFVYRATFGFISTDLPPAATLVPTLVVTPTP
jgi:hypothetical protein